ncbi:MAG: sigma-70 family RNA polymerase sigma factor [Chitinispirillaceae bacterium]|jgi:RNA polymerase sigma factor (sigma-70 family)|nr:sigma-70 family RNA polymerase sigma factor [Chitinispirillaceae bacterium]
MKVEFLDHDLKLPYVADDLLLRKCHKLERMLHRFPSESLSLKCELSPASGKKAYQFKLHLSLPDATISASAVDKSIVTVLGAAFKKLFGSVSELKTTLRAQQETIQKTDDARRSLDNISMTQNSRKSLSEFFGSRYGRFYNYALREIRFRQYQGYLKPGTIDIEDILNDALLIIAKEFNLNFNKDKAVRLIFKEIKQAIDRQLKPGGTALIPFEAEIEPEKIDIVYDEYYQPDETITVEDILIDPDSIIPEQEVEYKEIETHIDKLLAQLPADWREAFILSVREDLPVSDIAINRGKSTNEIRQDIESAKAFIREKLKDTGFKWKE